MAWIESHDDIWEHHKLDHLQEKLAPLLPGLDVEEIRALLVGQLHSLWHFVLRNAWRDANLEKWGESGIERAARWKKEPGAFVRALREVGFLDGWLAHGWMDRAGDLVWKRLEREKLKTRGGPGTVRGDNGGRSVPVREATVPDRTVHNRTEQLSPPKATASDGFEAFWAAYPRKVAKQAALRGWRRIKANQELLARILAAVERHKQSEQWQQDGGRFIPHPATWLNQKRWEDEVHDGYQDAGAAKPIPGKYARVSES